MIDPGLDLEGGGPWPAFADLLAAGTLLFLVLFAVVIGIASARTVGADEVPVKADSVAMWREALAEAERLRPLVKQQAGKIDSLEAQLPNNCDSERIRFAASPILAVHFTAEGEMVVAGVPRTVAEIDSMTLAERRAAKARVPRCIQRIRYTYDASMLTTVTETHVEALRRQLVSRDTALAARIVSGGPR